MKIYSRIIPENTEIGQKKTTSSPKGDFEALFDRVLRQELEKTSSVSESNLASLSPELSSLLDTVLKGLEELLSPGSGPEAALKLREEAQELFEGLRDLPGGPSRDLLEEVALLGVVEAEKRLS